MPKLIKDGVIVEDESPEVLDLEQWLASELRCSRAVELEPGETIAPLMDCLDDIPLVMINFPTFMDGRGFSYAMSPWRGWTQTARTPCKTCWSSSLMEDAVYSSQTTGRSCFITCATA